MKLSETNMLLFQQLKAVQEASAGSDGEGLAQLIADLQQLIGLTEGVH